MMDNTLIVAGLTFVVGLLVGMGLDRLIRRDAARSRRLAQQVDQTREEYTRYQAQVNEHFMETAQLVKRMNDAYQEVNQHLARGASRLCNDDEWQNSLALEAGSGKPRLKHTEDLPTDDVEPPRDYAPKKSPDEQGTLAEDYGFAENRPTRH